MQENRQGAADGLVRTFNVRTVNGVLRGDIRRFCHAQTSVTGLDQVFRISYLLELQNKNFLLVLFHRVYIFTQIFVPLLTTFWLVGG